MTERVIMAGFGGQGLMLIGKLLAEVAMHEGKQVTYFPCYGTEVRGGTANCHVVVSDEEIFSPVVEEADSLIIMNQDSYDTFAAILKPEGALFLNTSMAKTDPKGKGRAIGLPATELATSLGNVLVANMIMVGAYNAAKEVVADESIVSYLETSLTGKKHALLGLNKRALAEGRRLFEKISRST